MKEFDLIREKSERMNLEEVETELDRIANALASSLLPRSVRRFRIRQEIFGARRRQLKEAA